MKRILILCLLTFLMNTIQAQTEKDTVIQAIKTMFDGMRDGDSAAISSVFADNIQMFTIFKTKKGEHKMVEGNAQKFLTAVGTPHDQVWDEKIWSYDVKIDGLMANAWTEYSFYLGDKFSHCGVNVFSLFKDKEKGWQIVNITDTRRRADCEMSRENTINVFLDNWHKAAAEADEDTFFGSMTEDGIYIGTDISERWKRDELKEWSKKYFERESAWTFKATERNVSFSDDGTLAWFDEKLDTWMGDCRGSGVLQLTSDGWKIKHYHLSIAVPNDVVKEYLKLLKKD
jgi:hypothetical protein